MHICQMMLCEWTKLWMIKKIGLFFTFIPGIAISYTQRVDE